LELPAVNQKFFYLFGSLCFAVQVLVGFVNLYLHFNNLNVWSVVGNVFMNLFYAVVAYFFFYMYTQEVIMGKTSFDPKLDELLKELKKAE
jgi:hypothetical protein